MNSTCASLLLRGFLGGLLGALLAAGCVSTSSSTTAGGYTGPWLAASPTLQSQIDDNAKRLPWTHGVERVQMIQWFASIGEPAYPKLLELVKDPRTDVAGAAYASLGATRDSRLVEHIHAIPASVAETSPDLRYERARALLRLGDFQAVPTLIEGLRDERPLARALCSQSLIEATHENFGFDPRGEDTVREEAVKKWEAWWSSRQGDPLISGSKTEKKPDASEERRD
jgi:hypothetical protein